MTTPSGGSLGTPPTHVTVNADGTINYGASVPTSVPVGNGAVSLWNIPQAVLDYEQQTNPNPFWSKSTTTNVDTKHFSKRFLEANDSPTHSGTENAYTDAAHIMANFAAMSYNNPSEFAQLQHWLSIGPWGAISKNELNSGAMGPDTERAIGSAMDQYLKLSRGAGVPVNFIDYLQGLGRPLDKNGHALPATGNGGATGGSGSTLPSRPTLTDPDTLRSYAQKAAEAALGHLLTADQLNQFVDQFHNEQTSSYNAALGGQGTVINKDDPASSAEAFVQGADPTGFGQHEVTGYASALLNELLSGSAQQPNQNVDAALGMTQ